ncbi:MAG: response regulator [Sterolibacterium sp.]|nr:response regulator [Sterolibacterium sp.]MBP9799657.1 response regulator [Sterolibacterium sp.]
MTTDAAHATHSSPHPLLIVEDDRALAGYLAAALTTQGYHPRLAHDRPQALALLSEPPLPELVLLDLGLPPQPAVMSEGLALLDELLLRIPQAKIIVLTGQDENAAALEAVRRGAFDFLIKPAALNTLQQALQRARLFVREEARLAASGETRLHLTARLDEGPKEAAAAAEEQLVRRTLTECDYNVAEAARRLGMAREHLYYYLKKYGIQRPA